MKVTHFVTDEKFIKDAIALLNSIEELDNRFINISYGNHSLEFLEHNLVECVDISQVPSIISDKSDTDVIVLHNLGSLPCRFIKAIPKEIKVVWFAWGFDIYSNRYPQSKIINLKGRIKPHTESPRIQFEMIKKGVKPFLRKVLGRRENEQQDFIRAIERMDYFSGVFPVEYEMAVKQPFFHAKQIHFNYPFKQELFPESDIRKDLQPKGDTIQIGNCASNLGNHRNTFWRIRHLDIGKRKLFTPLSYGGDSSYVSSVCKMGRRLFGENFLPLIDFMPSDEYISLTESVSVAIHNVEQQAAVGNILLNLWNGAKVFLPETSLGYRHFKSLGFHVFSIESELNQENIDTHLEDDAIITNRILIYRNHSFERIKEKTRNSFLVIYGDIHNHQTT